MKYIVGLICAVLVMTACGGEEEEANAPAKSESARKLMADSTNLSVGRLDELNDMIVEDPDNANLYHERAYYYFHQKDIDNAMADIKKAIEMEPKSSTYYFSKGYFFHAMLQLEEAKTAFLQSIELDDQNEDAHLFLAKIYMALARPNDRDKMNYDNASLELRKVIEINEFNSEAYFWRGVIYEEVGDTGVAVSNYKTAIETNPEYYDAFIRLGMLYAMDDNPKAEATFQSAIDIRPNSTEAHFALAKYYQDHMKLDEAEAAYNTVIQIDSLYSIAYLNLGYMYMTYDTLYDKAIEYLHRAVYFNPGGFLPMTYHNIG